MRITTVIDEKEIIDLNEDDLIFIRGKVFKKVNTSGMMPCITCCFSEVVPYGNKFYCSMMVATDTSEIMGSLCYSKATNEDDMPTTSFREIKVSLFVARLIWKSIREI